MSNNIQKNIVSQGRDAIIADDHTLILEIYEYIKENHKEQALDLVYIFNRLFLIACTKGTNTMVQYFIQMYDSLDSIAKIALRHSLIYGKVQLQNRGCREEALSVNQRINQSIEVR